MNFKEEYKKAAGSLTPDKECVDRMKAAVLENISRPKSFPFKRVALVGGAVAACAVITVAAITVVPLLSRERVLNTYMGNDAALSSSESCAGYAEDIGEEGISVQSNGSSALSDFGVNSDDAAPSDNLTEIAAASESDMLTTTVNPAVGSSDGGYDEEPRVSDTLEDLGEVFPESGAEPETTLLPNGASISPSVIAPEPFEEAPGMLPVETSICDTAPSPTNESETIIGADSNSLEAALTDIFEVETGDLSETIPEAALEPLPEPEGIEPETEMPPYPEVMEEETEAASETMSAETNPCTGAGVEAHSLDGIVLAAKEELFGEGVTALRIVGNSAMILNGDNVLIAYEATFVPGSIPSESDIPRTGAAIEKYGAEGEYLVCSNDINLIYVFDRQSGSFINAYKKIS